MRLHLPVLLVVALSLPAPANAVYQCDGHTDDCQCSANNPYPCCDNGGGNYGNCTWWAWHRACCDWAAGLPGWGNANTWAPNAQAHADYNVVSSPRVNSIAASNSGTYGHVAWVTAVNGGQITVTEMNCCGGCNNGSRTATYTSTWFNQGFIVQASCACNPGDTENRSCGNCGTETRTCQSDCSWGSWSSCGGEGVCSVGQTENRACGNCGTETRTCNGSCQWDGWSSCGGEGVCSVGQTEDRACGDCGDQSRTCDNNCNWGSWDNCEGADPGGGTAPCNTGQSGVCSEGVQRCVDGYIECEQTTFSSKEICDGLDNDCDGQIDEPPVCGDGGSPPPPDAAVPATDGAQPLPDGATHQSDGSTGSPDGGRTGMVDGVVGGCGCAAASPPSPAPLWLLLISLLVVSFLRRKPSH